MNPRSAATLWIAFGAGAAASAGLAFVSAGAVLAAWLANFAFACGIALGALMLQAMLALGGSRLAADWRAPFGAAARLLLPMPLLYLPVAVGMHALYPWMRGELHAGQGWYLNLPFALAREAAYFAVFAGGALMLARAAPTRAVVATAAIVLPTATTFAAFDWLMALDPRWHSTGFGLRCCVGDVIAAGALLALDALRAGDAGAVQRRVDAANLLLAATLGWLYLLFTDYLTAWTGNLPGEAGWYVARGHGVWLAAIGAVIAAHVLAVLLLLSRALKRDQRALAAIALLLLGAQWLHLQWVVLPASHRAGAIAWAASATTLLAIFAAAALWLRRRPPHAPTAREVPAHG